MERVAQLSTDKEQLEHLVTQLQDLGRDRGRLHHHLPAPEEAAEDEDGGEGPSVEAAREGQGGADE